MSGKDIHTRGRAITRIRHAGSAEPDNPPDERIAATRTVASNSGEGRSGRQGSAVPSPGVRGRAVRRRYPAR